MKKHDIIKSAWIMTILALSTSVFSAGRPAPVNLTPEGKKLEAHYSKMLEDLKKEIVSQVPGADEKAKAEFTSSWKRFAMSRLLPRTSKTTSPRSCGKSP